MLKILLLKNNEYFTELLLHFQKLEDSLKKQFEAKNLSWPPQSLYIRSFKYDR